MKNIILSAALAALPVFGISQTFTEIIKTVAFDRAAEDRFGYAVDISGNYAIVGAYADDFGPVDPNMGSAYIFEKTGIEDWTFVQKISSSDQGDYDRFGWSVAINGNYAVVGAYAEDQDENGLNTLSKAGSAYIFERTESGEWTEVQKIVASDRDEDDWFGWSVDISGETIIVGAQQEGHDEIGEDFIFRSGSVYAFNRSIDGMWTESQKIVAWDRQPDYGGGDETMSVGDYMDIDYGDLFGCTIAISGDFMIVGANNNDFNPSGFGGSRQAGAAYIFHRVDGIWEDDQKICATIRQGWDRYGYSVDIDSNVAVVGAKAEDESEFEAAFLHNAGSAYIYQRGIDGTWTTVQKIDASDRGVGDHFGIDVAIDGNFMVIGAESNNFDEDEAAELNNAGAAYIFEKAEDGTWSEIQKIDASDRVLEDWFGNAIAISNHTIIVGAWQQDFNEISLDSISDAGAAYFFSSLLCEEETNEQSISICAGDSYTIGAHTYEIAGIYIDTLSSILGCDSIVTTDLTVIEPLYSDQTIAICAGESYSIGAHTYEITGIYIDTLNAITGCDSIVTTDLTVIEPLYSDQTIAICAGESYSIGAHTYEITGIYIDTLNAITGCDSIVTTDLTIEPAITHDQSIHLCYGETYEIGASSYAISGLFVDTLVTEAGCDSIVTTDLFIEEENTHAQAITICFGESITVGESIYNASGEYVDVLESATFCDSTVTTTLTVLPEIDVTVTIDGITLTGGDPAVLSATYQWIKCDPYTLIDGATDASFTAEENGDYAVIITDGTCSDTSDCVNINQVGVNEQTLGTLKIYPNPSNGQFVISLTDYNGEAIKMSITNQLGAIVYNGVLTQTTTNFDFSDLSKGIYLIQLTNGESVVVERISLN